MVELLEYMHEDNKTGDGYGNLQIAPEEGEVTGETALWRAVITQALMDAGSQSSKSEMQYERAQAIAWLTGNSDDFLDICLRAGMNQDYVRQQAKQAIKRGCTWRKAPGYKRKRPVQQQPLPPSTSDAVKEVSPPYEMHKALLHTVMG